MSTSSIEQFKNQTYLNLETFRKTGAGVKTPVWFVEENGVLLIRTVAGSAKVKRLHRNKHVRLAPCDGRGNVTTGVWVDGEAVVDVDTQENRRVNDLVAKKYGPVKWIFDFMNIFMRNAYVVIRVIV